MDDALQIEQVNNAVSAGNQAIIVAANGSDAISSALKEAVAALNGDDLGGAVTDTGVSVLTK